MVSDFQAEAPCPTRVFVNGTRLPAEDVDVHLRKEGPLAINRYAEVNFASPHSGKDFLSVFNRFDDDQSEPDRLRITCRDQKKGQYGTLFHGVVTGVGDSNDTNNKIHHCRGRGPEFFLNQIPASNEYSNDLSASEVTKYVVNELNENLVLSITGGGTTSETIEDAESSAIGETANTFFDIAGPIGDIFEAGFNIADDLFSEKTFTANKHYLSDVINWLQDKLNARIWIQPTKKGGVLTTASNPTEIWDTHTAHYLGGDTRIIDNNALAELRPINTIIVKGGVRRSTGVAFNTFGPTIGDTSKKFTKTKVRHETLYQRANEKELSDTVVKTDAKTRAEVENEAKSILKKRIGEATNGTMSVVHDRFIQPFNLITAKPTVNSEDLQTIDPIEYEVARCHYKVRPSEANVVPQIELNCGIKTSNDDLVVVNSWEKDA